MSSCALWRRTARRTLPLLPPSYLSICLFVSLVSILSNTSVWAYGEGSLPVPGSTIAIADFNGDLRLDLATVHCDPGSASLTHYRLEVRFAAGGRQTIPLLGPWGGLRIAARDVNGDKSPDIVVSSAWQDRPLVVLLNDGHGVFSLADPASYPAATGQPLKRFENDSRSLVDAAVVPAQSLDGTFSGSGCLLDFRPTIAATLQAHTAAISNSLLSSLPGRAPPAPSLSV